MLVDRHSDVSAGRFVKKSISDESFIKIHRPGVKKNRSVLSKLSEKKELSGSFLCLNPRLEKLASWGFQFTCFFSGDN